MRRDLGGIALAAAALLPAVPARAQAAADPRGELETVARALGLAVSKVSHPVGWTLMPEGEAALGYYVGTGVVFVVSPRAVPARTVALPPESGSALSRVMQVVEHTLEQAESPETRERLQKTLDGLKRQQEELSHRAAAQERDRASLQKLTEERLARLSRDAGQGVGADGRQRVQDAAAAEEALRRLEAEAAAFQREAESARQAADNALSELAQEMRQRLGASNASAPAPGDQLLAGPGEPPVPLFVAPPPWRAWVADEPARELRPAATVVGEVREAVTGVLVTHSTGLHLLEPQDVVVVTVDFVPQGSQRLRVRPERTLVVKVRKQELQEAGRSRIQYIEY